MGRMYSEGKSAAPARVIEIGAEEGGQRIDNFLLRHLKGVPRSHVYRVLRSGQVRVNSGRIRADYRLKTGDRVRVPPVRGAAAPAPVPRPSPALQRLEAAVLYEDEGLLILNKPAGTAVHGGSGLSYGVIEALRALRPHTPPLELVHRLDRATSGCLMVAKKRSLLRALHDLLRRGQIDKRYLALVAGRWRGGEREVSAALVKNILQGGERMVKVGAQGKPALSHFRPLQVYHDASLVEVRLDTGRTHQIRVHAAHIGHPLAGDDKYGDAAFNRRMRDFGLRRLFLHAHALSFTLPGTPREIHVSAPLDPDLRLILDILETHETA